MRTQLKTKVDKGLMACAKEVVAIDAKILDAERPERRKQKVEPSIQSLCARVQGCTVERIVELSEKVKSLPATPEYAPALSLIAKLKDRAVLIVGGDEVPPITGWVHRDLLPELIMSCQFLGCNIHELTAVAWYQAGQEQPEAFAEACDDLAKHAQMIEQLKATRAKLVQEAADAMTLDDLEIHFYSGSAKTWFAGTNREVPASAPGDPQGIEALVRWLHVHPETAAAL